jgi:hypothetical protein
MTHAVLHHRRQRDQSGQLSHKHGHVQIGALRRIYGPSFATTLSPATTLYEVLELFGPHSLSELHLKMLQQDFDDGLLERKIKKSWRGDETIKLDLCMLDETAFGSRGCTLTTQGFSMKRANGIGLFAIVAAIALYAVSLGFFTS